MKKKFTTVVACCCLLGLMSFHYTGNQKTAGIVAAKEIQKPVPVIGVIANDSKLTEDEMEVFKVSAKGVQMYECRPMPDGNGKFAWVFVAPKADLFDDHGYKIGTHYAGPTWEYTKDGSKVKGKKTEEADAPVKDAIKWLILSEDGHEGDGLFSRVVRIMRVETHGGKAPSDPLTAADAGKKISIPYTAVYYFYLKKIQ